MKHRRLTITHCAGMVLCLLLIGSPGSFADGKNVPEPEVTVRHEEGHTLYEYRANGLLYLIKVVPKNGPAYFLIDPDGMGNYIRADKSDLLIPSWIIHSW